MEDVVHHHHHLPHDRSSALWNEGKPTALLKSSMRRWIAALMSDEGITTLLARDDQTVRAEVKTREAGMVAGLAAVYYLLQEWLPGATWTFNFVDGGAVEEGDCLMTLEGGRLQILAAERVILNILGRLSGIATMTRKWVDEAGNMRVASTRKVHWGLLDKWAVHLGGGLTHRLTRGDARMIKENDLATMHREGEKKIDAVRRILDELKIEECGAFIVIEVGSIDQAIAAAASWNLRMDTEGRNDRLTIMLDNMDAEVASNAVLDLTSRNMRSFVVLEASGNVKFENLKEWAEMKVDLVSSSGLHSGTPPLDLTMLFEGAERCGVNG